MSLVKEIAKQVLSYFPYRYVNVGKEFHHWMSKFEGMKEMSYEQLREAQFRSFADMVKLAYEDTNFYRTLYDSHGFHPSQLKDFSDIDNIPVINKDAVRNQGLSMIVSKYKPNRLHKKATSGTTGTSLTLYSNRIVEQREWAAICYQWARVGYKPGDGRIDMRGSLPNGKLMMMDRYARTLSVNTTKLNEDNIEEVARAVSHSGYRYLYGFPSSLTMFGRLLEERHLQNMYSPDAILLASEMVHDFQVRYLRSLFPAAQIFAHYGQTEKVALGGWMNDCEAYYFLPLYSYVEQNKESLAIIGTSFINDVMPLIRYELTDVPSAVSQQPNTGIHYLYPIIDSIDGRAGEIMFKPNGEMLPSSILAVAVRGTITFTACKFIQHQYDLIEIIVESSELEGIVHAELQMVIDRLKQLFTEEMNFKITIVKQIPRSISGKFKSVEVRIEREVITI